MSTLKSFIDESFDQWFAHCKRNQDISKAPKKVSRKDVINTESIIENAKAEQIIDSIHALYNSIKDELPGSAEYIKNKFSKTPYGLLFN